MKRLGFQRWVFPIALSLVLSAGLLGLLFSRVRLAAPVSPTTEPKGIAPAITFSKGAIGSKDVQQLFDLEPLFLPTDHNASVLTLPPQALREPGAMSFTYAAKLNISEASGGVPLPDAIAVPGRPLEVLSLGTPPNLAPELGQADLPVLELPHRMAYLQVDSGKDGRTVVAEPVFSENGEKPPSEDWMPFTFVVAVDSAGLIGAPITATSNTSDEVETFFRGFLLKQFQLGARLAPGFYTVKIGP